MKDGGDERGDRCGGITLGATGMVTYDEGVITNAT